MLTYTLFDRVVGSLQPGGHLIQKNAKSMPILVDIWMTGFCKPPELHRNQPLFVMLLVELLWSDLLVLDRSGLGEWLNPVSLDQSPASPSAYLT